MVSPGLIPVQQIERIEIIKGAASGAWGSALGGVVNIVTKSPNADRPLAGVVSNSIGSRFTTDSRAELSGSLERLGYYLTAGHLRSDGLAPHTATSMDNLYGKLTYALPSQGSATLGLSQVSAWPGEGEGIVPRLGLLQQEGDSRDSYGFVRIQQPLFHRLQLEVLGYATGRDDRLTNLGRDQQGNALFLNELAVRDSTRGVNASLFWGDSRRSLVTGLEYQHVHGRALDLLSQAPPFYDRTWDSYAAYLNGAYSLGELTVLPGVRFDSTGFSGDHLSGTLGATYQLAAQTTLRAYAAHGFSLPMLADDTGTQRVTTVQGGLETGALPLLWLKATYFFNALRNTASVGALGSVTTTDQNRQGFELEGRSAPFHGFALTAGYTYLYALNLESGARLETNGQQTVPPQVYKLALHYDDASLGLRGALTGSGVAWNASHGYPASSAGMVWDLNLSYRPPRWPAPAPELFFSAHNLLDAQQTTNTILCTSTSRWFEGGARVHF